MWIVELALRRPYTFIVMAIAILLGTPLAVMRTPVDVLPEIDIPVVAIIWTFNGFSAQQMADRLTQVHERGLTTTVADIEHIESQSLAGISIVKVFFQPNADIRTAMAQVVAVSQSSVRNMPPGTTPPGIIKFTASSIPVIQLGLSSQELSEKEVFDAALNIMRPQGGGLLIHTASQAGRNPGGFSGPLYGAAKHGVVAMSHTINMEECVNGIRSTVFLPGEVATPILDSRPNPVGPEARAKMVQSEDCGDLIRYIACLPPHLVMNEVWLGPTHNRKYVAELQRKL